MWYSGVMAGSGDKAARRLAPWLRKRLPAPAATAAVRAVLDELSLATVCSSAHCPNQGECFARGTATFLLLGQVCTRRCRFCAIPGGVPAPVRADEPDAVAAAAARMALRHVVMTSVTRDDLPDGGAGQFAAAIRAVRRRCPAATIEVLTPDFRGDTAAVDVVLAAGADVFNHNVETVPRLYAAVRPQANYRRSLAVLARAARRAGGPCTKSGLMVGLGETPDEVRSVMRDLRRAGCDVLTIGQYLAPSSAHHPVARFVEPAQFQAWRADGRRLGFAAVAAGPFVRSSYQAGELFRDAAGT